MAETAIDRRSAISTEVILFEKAKWDVKGDKIQGKPGTWFFLQGRGVFLCCPKCCLPVFLHPKITKINRKGQLIPDFLCTNKIKNKPCHFHRKVFLDQWHENKRIYACAIIRNGKPEITYTQANSQKEAISQLGPCDSITAVAPAIGFFSHDKEGKVISTDGKLDNKDMKLYAELGIHNVDKKAIKD